MHCLRSMIELPLMQDDHSVVQIDSGLDRLLHFGIAGPGIDPMQLGRSGVHIAAIGRADWAVAVIDQRNVIDRCVCVIHVVECR